MDKDKEELSKELKPPSIDGYEHQTVMDSLPSKVRNILILLLILTLIPIVEPLITILLFSEPSFIWSSIIEWYRLLLCLLASFAVIFIIHELVHKLLYHYYEYSAKVRWADMYTISQEARVDVSEYYIIVLAPLVSITVIIIPIIVFCLYSLDFDPDSLIKFSLILFSLNLLLAGADIFQAKWLYKNCDQSKDEVYMKDITLTDRCFLNKHKAVGHIYRNKN